MLISFLKKEGDEGGGTQKFMGRGDIIFLLVLATLIFGFWYLYKNEKKKIHSYYGKCHDLFVADNFTEAKECYETARGISYFITVDSLESIGYDRIKEINDMSN
ncbi:MAG: hypothetical protein LBC85_05530 [Fibromonadaceae bacterium]|jgi:hypothetical protein|nr:hypothetical protein [Fibromonadaceae bacterium]